MSSTNVRGERSHQGAANSGRLLLLYILADEQVIDMTPLAYNHASGKIRLISKLCLKVSRVLPYAVQPQHLRQLHPLLHHVLFGHVGSRGPAQI